MIPPDKGGIAVVSPVSVICWCADCEEEEENEEEEEEEEEGCHGRCLKLNANYRQMTVRPAVV